MGNTINRVIPYPELTDAANVPVDMRELAERIDTVFGPVIVDTGWLLVTISPGFAAQVGSEPMMRRIGNVVYMKGGWAATGLNPSTTLTVGTFPAAIPKPITSYYMAMGGGAGNITGSILVGSGAGTSVQFRTGPTVGVTYWSGCFTLD